MKRQLFEQIKLNQVKHNSFDLSQEKKLSCNMADLIPILMQEVVPGDKFRVTTEMMLRMAPMLAPIMHRVNVFTHFFFVPNRLVWAEWQDFITGGENGSAAPYFPVVTITNAQKAQAYKGTLSDYLGVPTTHSGMTIAQNLSLSALPYRAYQLIWDEYYRDQNLQAKSGMKLVSTVDSNEQGAITKLRKRAWEKDYFTSALPWTQKGGAVTLPQTFDYKLPAIVKDSNGATVNSNNLKTSSTGQLIGETGSVIAKIENLNAVGITVNDLRRSTRLQEWLEKNARGGSRYVESILSHFGVRSSDARLQRPEYLGGGKQPVVISEVLNTSATATEPQGNMAGHGLSVGNTMQFNKSFEEHGYIIGIMSILPRTTYQQGVPRSLFKFDKFDYYWPEFANLGEQEIKYREIMMPYTAPVETVDQNSTFAYQSRYAEYKFNESSVHGDFRDTLSFWHLGRQFASQTMAFNEDFIIADPSHRIFAVTDPAVHKIYVQLYNDIKAVRPMPIFGTPQL